MKHLVYILLFCFSTLKAQNLITNPSFEDIDSCYGQFASYGFDVFKWSGCKGWSNPIMASSDLWCKNPIIGNMIPPNIISYQKPKSGNNMAGILISSDGMVNSYREFIQNKLIVTLEHDRIYKISFYYSVDAGSAAGGCPPNQFGVFGSMTEFKDTNAFFLSHLTPLASSDKNKFVDDTSGWHQCEIIFKANGGENYLTIGNFQDSSNTSFVYGCDTTIWDGLKLASDYFYLDDFSLEEFIDFSVPNVFTPNGDGVNDFVSFPNFGNSANKIVVVNRWGNLIYESNGINPIWDGKDTSGKTCTEGTYFYRINNTNISGFIQLMR